MAEEIKDAVTEAALEVVGADPWSLRSRRP